MQYDNQNFNWGGGGLIGILFLIAAIVLLFTGSYPCAIYDFVLGMNRWVLRVAAYAGLMTDDYPPFRLDMGGSDPGGSITISGRPPEPPDAAPGAGPTGPPAAPGARWTAGRIVSVVIGAVLVVASLGLRRAGGTALWADTTVRDSSGYLPLGSETYTTPSYAISSSAVRISGIDTGPGSLASIPGKARIRVTSTQGKPVFVGVAPAQAAAGYLAGTSHVTVRDFADGKPQYVAHAGGAPVAPPAATRIWAAQASGPGTQTIIWPARDGEWAIVAMNADGSSGVRVDTRVAATLPALPWIATGFLIAGGVLIIAGALLIVLAARAASRSGEPQHASCVS